MVYTGGIGQQSIAATRLVSDDVAAFKQYEMSLMTSSLSNCTNRRGRDRVTFGQFQPPSRQPPSAERDSTDTRVIACRVPSRRE